MLTKKYFKKITLEVRKQLVQPLLQLAKKHYAQKTLQRPNHKMVVIKDKNEYIL